ncbi:MAG: thioredoxin family protein [Candidatus Hodarchaeales archaeon]
MSKREIFNKMFEDGISYEEYIKKSDKHVERMKDSWSVIAKEVKKLPLAQVSRLNEKIHILCIAENWCSDCTNAVPVIARLSEECDLWNFRISFRDRFTEEVERFYKTAGRKKIPLIIFADEEGDEIIRWIERPTRSYHLLGMLRDLNLSKEEFLEQYNVLKEFKNPSISQEILRELIIVAEKASSIAHINSPKKKPSPIILH